MVIKYISLVLGLVNLAVSNDYFNSREYLKLSANDKMTKLWTEITKDKTPFSFYSSFELGKIFFEDLEITFSHRGDSLPEGRKKLIHTIGSIAKAEFIAEKDSPYTGVLKGSTNLLLRFSIAKNVDTSKKSAAQAEDNFVPGISLKFLRDGRDSGNLVAMYNTKGYPSWNPFKVDFTNSFPIPAGGVSERLLKSKFASVDERISSVGLLDMTTFASNGLKEKKVKYPFRLIFRPTKSVSSLFPDNFDKIFYEQLKTIKEGTTVYDVIAIDQPGCNEYTIGSIRLLSEFTTSRFADEKLFFRHDWIKGDDENQTNWREYRDSFGFWSGDIKAKEPKPKKGCPFAHLFQ